MKQLFLIAFSLLSIHTFAQDPTRFAGEIDAIKNRAIEKDTELPFVVFTGSSSIRMWDDLENLFPGFQVLNNGFGGSEFTDLIHYKNELIYSYSPDILFIYEGDNDINSRKNPSEILASAAFLYADIKRLLPDTKTYFISPKPSISRWNLKDDYEMLNELLKDFCSFDEQLTFIDVWTPMMDENGEVRKDLFIEDDLHMNEIGYAIWKEVIGEYLPQN